MDIKLISTETAESLIAKAGREIKKYLKILSSEEDFCKDFVNSKPRLALAIETYVSCVKRIKNVENNGWLKVFTEASKNLIQAFDFADLRTDRSFIVDAYELGKKSPVYLALEATFNASLFKEQGLQRRFKIVYNIWKNIIEFNENEYFLYATPYIYYVNSNTGRILRCTKKIDDFEYFNGSGFDIWYNNNCDTVYEDGVFLGKWVDATHPKRSGGKKGTLYKNVRFSSSPYISEYGGKTFDMPAHQVVMLCFYGLNVLKYCIGSGSLLTIDHKNGCSFDNGIMNLAVVTRVGNSKKGGGNEKPVNFLQLFEALQIANTPFLYVF